MDQPLNPDGQPLQPWEWPEPVWRKMTERARAGRSLRPKAWPGGARCAVALSFDADHDTTPLRDSDQSPMRISQGQYGSRQGIPRIRAALARHGVPASFFYPAVSALIYPDEVRALAAEGHEIGIHSWIHEANTSLPPGVERDLTFRAVDVLEGLAGRRPVGIRTASWDFSVNTLNIIRELGLLYDSSLMADDDAYEIEADGVPTGIVELPPEWDPRRRGVFQLRPLLGPAPVHAAERRRRHLQGGAGRRLAGRRPVPADHAPAHHRAPQPHRADRQGDRARQGARRLLVRDA